VKLAASSGHLPSSLFVVVTNESRDPLFGGGFSDIFRGTHQGQAVAIKRPRVVDAASDPRAVSLSILRMVLEANKTSASLSRSAGMAPTEASVSASLHWHRR
jgi:hypothetical protein